jgi:hypothetical protein
MAGCAGLYREGMGLIDEGSAAARSTQSTPHTAGRRMAPAGGAAGLK